ncbi:VOC family protein [Actinomycetospora cinnamomea]|uniref:Putative glyoxalase superfamily protein PhnB n=1 Tax=Actinomycetospora cinnamomea TaxID=663609 RepID=A0A2U1EBM0_9PSEU|nr:VOC family protein [Actinomycetospora cinnamomea]PVY97310.1 putative glyoxalase superfamily protein PhnB [Actinomycetospora cinnamomea]
MEPTGFYPVLAVTDVEASRRFWVEHFGFETTFAVDWYVSLRRPGPRGFELAFVAADHPTVPAGSRTPARGLLLNVEVDDVDAEYTRLVTRGGLRPELDLRTEDFGQRHFIVADPAGVLVDVIAEVPASAEYADAFSS